MKCSPIQLIASSVCLFTLCCCQSNPDQAESNESFQMIRGPKLYSEKKAKFFEIAFRDVNASRDVLLTVEYEDFTDEPLTDFDLMRGIQVEEGDHIMSHRTKWDPWGPREQSDGGLLSNLIPEQTRLNSKAIDNYQFIFTESGIGTTPDQEYSVRFEEGKFAGFEKYEPGTR